jgi:diguanylate cyclase (GGDEF)-like protein/PAS domain S-box-containing protein
MPMPPEPDTASGANAADGESRYRRIVEDQTELISLAHADGELVYVNPAYALHFGLTPAGMIGANLFDFVQPADQDAVRQLLASVLASGQSASGENRMLSADGSPRWVAWTNGRQHDAHGQALLHSVGRDITARKQAEQQLVLQAATLRSVTEAIPATIAIVGADGIYRFVNTAFERWHGTTAGRVIGRSVRSVLGEDEFQRLWPWVQRALAGEQVSFHRDHSDRDTALHLSISYIPLRLPTGEVDGFVAMSQDITPQKQEERRLQQLSQRDALTGLLNRTGFEDHLDRMLVQGHGEALALLYIDLDRFKPVNDEHGHPVGDQVLKLFAQRLVRVVRPSDAVARLGGDEFAVMLSGLRALADARTVADKVIAVAQAPFEVGSRQLSIGASVGIAFGVEPETGWGDLLERADEQLYRAKAAGRGRRAGSPD